jgi:hypothetical protein
VRSRAGKKIDGIKNPDPAGKLRSDNDFGNRGFLIFEIAVSPNGGFALRDGVVSVVVKRIKEEL